MTSLRSSFVTAAALGLEPLSPKPERSKAGPGAAGVTTADGAWKFFKVSAEVGATSTDVMAKGLPELRSRLTKVRKVTVLEMNFRRKETVSTNCTGRPSLSLMFRRKVREGVNSSVS